MTGFTDVLISLECCTFTAHPHNNRTYIELLDPIKSCKEKQKFKAFLKWILDEIILIFLKLKKKAFSKCAESPVL